MEVVSRDQREPDLRREPEQLLVEPGLLGKAVVLQLEEEVVRAEDVAVLAGDAFRKLPVVDLEGLRDFAAETRGQPDQALAVSSEVLTIDPRAVVVAIDDGRR